MNIETRSISKVLTISMLVLAACTSAVQAEPVGSRASESAQETAKETQEELVVETVPEEGAAAGSPEAPPNDEQGSEQSRQSVEVELLDPNEPPPSGASSQFSTDFSMHSIPYSEVLSGGPPKDGIPAVDNPQYVSIDEADDWIEALEPVILLQSGESARAYPVQILMWHEVVNDVLGGEPVVVTFCPLCNTGIVFDRNLNGEVLDFGTTGRLRFSNLIMYDRQTETWWQQASGAAIAGELTGEQLTFLPAALISWEEFKNSYPEGDVLSKETGFQRAYGQNPYTGYDNINSSPFLYRGPSTPDELPAVARVLTVDLDEEAVAYPYLTLEEVRVANDTVGGTDIVVFWEAGTASALDSNSLAEGRDVGTANAFSRLVDGQSLTFSYDGENIIDDQTGSMWNILGQAESGELAGTQLEQVISVNHFWFSWAAFKPETRIYQP
jgi:hypothetical protein